MQTNNKREKNQQIALILLNNQYFIATYFFLFRF